LLLERDVVGFDREGSVFFPCRAREKSLGGIRK